MSKLKQLLRTNVALTSNYKLIVGENYDMFFESYNSNSILSQERYKHYRIYEDSIFSEQLALFYKDTSAQTVFEVKQDTNTYTVQSDYNNQYDTMYWSGSATVEDNWYKEMYEYSAPLMLDKHNLPDGFVVMRIDGPGIGNPTASFLNEFVDKAKIVRYANLNEKTSIGKFLAKNIKDNKYFPTEPLEMNFKKFGFSKWKGIEMELGGYCEKSFFLDEQFSSNTSHFDFEEFITNGFSRNKVIMPHILNFKFLFNDYPAKPDVVSNTVTTRKWSINRYTGFYVKEKQLVRKYTPYQELDFKSGLYLINNVFSSTDVTVTNVDPILKGFTSDFKIFCKIEDTLHEIRKDGDKYVLISEKLFNGKLSDFRKDKAVKLEYDSNNVDLLLKTDDNNFINLPYEQDTYSNRVGANNTTQSIYALEVNGEMYTIHFEKALGNNPNVFTRAVVNTDHIIKAADGILSIKTYDSYTEVEYKDPTGEPMYFNLYKLELCEIADLDFKRTDTLLSRYEYENNNEIPYSLEPKLWNYDALTEDVYREREYDIMLKNDDLNLPLNGSSNFAIPSSTEYSSDSDLFILNQDNKLTDIWNKSQSVNKWEYKSSLSNNDYPYKLNISALTMGAYNKAPGFDSKLPQRNLCNLDWFYILGCPRVEDNNVTDVTSYLHYLKTEYDHYTLHIDNKPELYDLITENDFWKYHHLDSKSYSDPNLGFDYFTWFMSKSSNNSKNVKSTTEKWSYFNDADLTNGPHTLFKGMKVFVFDDTNENVSNGKPIYNIDAKYNGYKFSVVLSKRPTVDTTLHGKSGVTVYVNNVYGNIMICVYVYVPFNSLTSIECVKRDDLYVGTKLLNNDNTFNIEYNYMYDLNVASGGLTCNERLAKQMNLSPQHLTLYNIISHINDAGYNSGFTYPLEYININAEGDVATKAKLVIESPDMFSINIKSNIVKYEKVDLQPYNKLSNLNTTLVYEDTPNLIDSIYADQPLVRKRDVNKNTLSPVYYDIYRFSGPYWPITNRIELFTKPVLHTIQRRSFDLTNPVPLPSDVNFYSYDVAADSMYFDTQLVDGEIQLKVRILNDKQLYEFYVGDIIYIWQYTPSTPIRTQLHERLLTVSNTYAIPGDSSYYLNARLNMVNKHTVKVCSTSNVNVASCPSTLDGYTLLPNDLILLKSQTTTTQNGIWRYPNVTETPGVLIRMYTWNEYLDCIIHVVNGTSNSGGYITNADYNTTGVLGTNTVTIYKLKTQVDFQMVHYRYLKPNTLFDVNLKDFGLLKDLIVSKTTQNPSPLQTGYFNNKYISVYPMIDEFGVSCIDHNIFKSSWDDTFYNEIKINKFRTE